MPNTPNASDWGLQIRSTVIPAVLPGVAFFTMISVIVTLISDRTGYKMEVNTIMLAIVGTMISFAISLRTSTANDRYTEGRRAWSTIVYASRQFAFAIWLYLPETTLKAAELAAIGDGVAMEIEKAKGLIEKRTIINLVHAFAVATKHYLRSESGVYYEDLFRLIACLPKYDFPASTTQDIDASDDAPVLGLWTHKGVAKIPSPALSRAPSLLKDDKTHKTRRRERQGTDSTAYSMSTEGGGLGQSQSTSRTMVDLEKGFDKNSTERIVLGPADDPPATTVYDVFPPLLMIRPLLHLCSKRHRKLSAQEKQQQFAKERESNVPLQISLFLSGYIAAVIDRGVLAPAMWGVALAPLGQLQDSITTLERVLTTPLPFAYQAHLRLSVYIYLIFLPVQTYALLGWINVVAQVIASVIFLGFLELGAQLENPFGYDDSDLPLTHYCELIGQELAEIVSHSPPNPSSYIFSSDNIPFGPRDTRTASEIIDDTLSNTATVSTGTGETRPSGYRTPSRDLRKMMAQHCQETWLDTVQHPKRPTWGRKDSKDLKKALQSVEVLKNQAQRQNTYGDEQSLGARSRSHARSHHVDLPEIDTNAASQDHGE